MGYCAAVGARRLVSPGARTGGTGNRLEAGNTTQRGHGAGAGGAAAQAAVIRMAEAPAGRLDVGLGPVERCVAMIDQGIQAGQTGTGRQEDCQQEERLERAKLRSPEEAGAMHVLEYTQARSSAAVRRTGPSAGSRNQNAAPFP